MLTLRIVFVLDKRQDPTWLELELSLERFS